jgi:hypothetical protein
MRFFPFVLITVLLTGCAKPELLRHYKAAERTTLTQDPGLKIRAFAVTPTKGTEDPPPVLRLSERAQAALVQALAAKIPAEKLLANIMAEESPKSGGCAWADKTTITKRLYVTTIGELPLPADRIDRLELDVTFSDGPYRATFRSWDRFDSTHLNIDFGKAVFKQTNTIGLEAGKTSTANLADDAGSIEKALGLKAERSTALEETVAYAGRRLSVGSALEADRATLVQEGGPLYTLFGTISATLTVKLQEQDDTMPIFKLTLRDENGDVAPDKASVTRCYASASPRSDPLKLDITGHATLRLVSQGDGTVPEGDDNVKYARVDLPVVPISLVSAKELEFNAYGLAVCTAAGCSGLGIQNIDSPALEYDELMVSTQEEASVLRKWLVAQISKGNVDKLEGRPIVLIDLATRQPRQALTAARVNSLGVHIFKTNASGATGRIAFR